MQVGGGCGLLERGAEKVRRGRGRGDFNKDESELEVEMTEAFLLRSASDG